MSVVRLPLLVTVVVVVAMARASSAAYCDDNLFRERRNSNDDETRRQPPQQQQRQLTSDVKFTKELSTTEYGPLNSFKTLHCCGERYLSLEWFKDNRPYPWPSDVSSFILNPESANQTIYTRSLTPSDHGVYTCQLANQTNIVNHSIQLTTIDVKSYWGDPLPTYQMPVRHYAQPGDSIRLYCEGFVGKVDLPDAVNTISWKKVGGNQTFGSSEKYRIEEVIRENTQVLGAFLFINNLEETDYGRYMCSISNTDDQTVEQFTNITRPVLHKKQSHEKVHRDCRLIIIVMLTSILIILLKRRQFSSLYKKLKKKFENNKYALSEKTVHSIIVFYAEESEEDVNYLLEKMNLSDHFVIKKYRTDFGGDFVKTHTELVKGYDFVIYLVSSVASSLIASITQNTGSPNKRYIIDYSDMPETPTKSWRDRVLVDLNETHLKRNHQNVQNKSIRIV